MVKQNEPNIQKSVYKMMENRMVKKQNRQILKDMAGSLVGGILMEALRLGGLKGPNHGSITSVSFFPILIRNGLTSRTGSAIFFFSNFDFQTSFRCSVFPHRSGVSDADAAGAILEAAARPVPPKPRLETQRATQKMVIFTGKSMEST